MFSNTTLGCIVDLMCILDHMCMLACNVCGGITAVAFSCCGILHLTLRGSTSLLFVDQHLDLHGIRAVLYLWEATIVWTPALSVVYICLCRPPKRRVYTITSLLLQHFYFFATCPIYQAKVSHYYRPTSVDTASAHIVKGITQNTHKRS